MDELTARDFGGRTIGPRDLTTPLAAGPRWDTVQHLYTVDSMKPPPDNYLLVGEIAVSLADPMALWVGVPTSMSANGYRQLVPTEAPADGRVYGRNGQIPAWQPVAPAIGGGYVAKSGDTMTGPLVLPGNATLALQAVPLQQLQSQIAAIPLPDLTPYLQKAGGTMTGFLTLNANPSAALHAVPLQYLQANYAPIAGGGYVQKTGDTMTGTLTISPAAGYASVSLNKAAASTTQGNQIIGSTGGSGRWIMRLGDATAESSGNVGSDFAIYRYDNAGGYLGNPFSITRATGIVSVAQDLYLGGLGIVYSGITGNAGHRNAFIWDNSWIQVFVDGAYQYQLASIPWVQNNFKNIGAYTPNQNVDYNSGPTFAGAVNNNTFTTGYIQANNSIMNATGVFYVANNQNYYLARNSSNGYWYFVENGTVNFSVDTGGGINPRTWITCPNANFTSYLTVGGDSVLHNVYIDGGLGLNFRGVYNSGVWYAFGWDGSRLNFAINGGGQGQLAPQSDVDGRATYGWVSGNFCGWGATWNCWDFTVGGTLFANNGRAQFNTMQTNYIWVGGSGIDCAQTIQCTDGWGFRSTWLSGDAFSVWWNGSVGVIRYNRSWDLSLQAFMGSDIRMKQDIGPSSFDCLAAIRKVALYEFRWRDMTRMYDGFKPREGRGPMERVGFVAQWLREVVPEFVYVPPPNPDAPNEKVVALWEINATAMLGALCGAMQELASRVEAIERLIT